MRPKIDINKLKHLPTTEDMFVDEYGAKGTTSRDEFDAKSRAWYYAFRDLLPIAGWLPSVPTIVTRVSPRT